MIAEYAFWAFRDVFPDAQYPGSKCLRKEHNVLVLGESDVIIGNDVWIGVEATIMSGLTIGDGAVIGAKSAATKNAEPYAIVAGNPARLIRKGFDEETMQKSLEIRWWNWPIARVRDSLNIPSGSNSLEREELFGRLY